LIEIDPRYPKVGKKARKALQKIMLDLEAQAAEGAAADPFEAE
jgi:hypothetical protein